MPEITEDQKKALDEQKKQCPFCRIVAGEIPAVKIYEDNMMIAVLDINPATKGHTLVMPKEHYPILALLPSDIFKHMFNVLPELCTSIEDALISDGSQIFIASGGAAGQNVGHFMLHIIPREGGDGLDKFTLQKKELPQEKYDEIKKILSTNLSSVIKRKGSAVKFTKEQVVQVISQNPQVKEMLVKDPLGFKQAIPKNPQLSALFKEVDFDEIYENISGKKIEKSKKTKVREANEADEIERESNKMVESSGDAKNQGKENKNTVSGKSWKDDSDSKANQNIALPIGAVNVGEKNIIEDIGDNNDAASKENIIIEKDKVKGKNKNRKVTKI